MTKSQPEVGCNTLENWVGFILQGGRENICWPQWQRSHKQKSSCLFVLLTFADQTLHKVIVSNRLRSHAGFVGCVSSNCGQLCDAMRRQLRLCSPEQTLVSSRRGDGLDSLLWQKKVFMPAAICYFIFVFVQLAFSIVQFFMFENCCRHNSHLSSILATRQFWTKNCWTSSFKLTDNFITDLNKFNKFLLLLLSLTQSRAAYWN